jgi:hypothetical protein
MRLQMLCALTAIGGLLAAAAPATTVTPLDLQQLTAQAPLAVLAEVTAAPDRVTGDGSYRLATIAVRNAIWGTSEQSLQVLLPGGVQKIGKLSVVSVVPGTPELFVGSRLMLLLKPSANGAGFEIVGFNQGAFNVSSTGEVVLPGENAPMRVEQAMQRIREVRAEGAPLQAPAPR